MPATIELKRLVDQMPAPDERDMYTQGIDKQAIEAAVAEMYRGGSETVVGLIEMLALPGSLEDVKPRYALRCLANHILALDDEEARQAMALDLAQALLGDHPPHVKQFLCQELQWSGGAEAVPALGKQLADPELAEAAAMALLAIRHGVAEQFRGALPNAQGHARLTIIQALGDLQDGESIEFLRATLPDPDREIRLAAGWALAKVGDAGAVDLLIQEADARQGWERIQATKHCFLLAERLTAAGSQQQARQIYSYLKKSRTQTAEAYVREAAERALETA